MTNQSSTRINQQLNVLYQMSSFIEKVTKITITPTRVTIKSQHKIGDKFIAQAEGVNEVLKVSGHLPFTVDLVPHG